MDFESWAKVSAASVSRMEARRSLKLKSQAKEAIAILIAALVQT
jgi:hypothetical protein